MAKKSQTTGRIDKMRNEAISAKQGAKKRIQLTVKPEKNDSSRMSMMESSETQNVKPSQFHRVDFPRIRKTLSPGDFKKRYSKDGLNPGRTGSMVSNQAMRSQFSKEISLAEDDKSHDGAPEEPRAPDSVDAKDEDM
jgi:hypothetical protein